MNCAECKELLVTYAEGLADTSQAGALEKHLSACDKCRAELSELHALQDRLSRNGKAVAQTDLESEVMNRVIREQKQKLNAADAALGKLRRVESAGGVQHIWRLIMNTRLSRYAAAAVVALAVIFGISQFGGDGASKVYASAIEHLQAARTLTFSLITVTGMDEMPTVRTDILYKDPGLMRTSTPDGYICIVDATITPIRGISLVPGQTNYVSFEFTEIPDDVGKDPWASAEELRSLPAAADEQLGQAKIDGRLLEGFRVTQQGETATVWIDAATGRLARVELEYDDAPGMNVIMTDFRFDAVLDDSLFSLEPPAGYTQIKVAADVAQVTEADFIEFLRMWSSWTVDKSFPPKVVGADVAKITMQMAQEGKFVGQVAPGYEDKNVVQIMYNGFVFASVLPEGTWRYAGQNVAFGDPDTPIFWYQPRGSDDYRVIHADLSVTEVAADQLPQ